MITFFGGKVQRNKKVFRSGIFQRTKTNLDFTDTGMSFRLWYTSRSTTLVFIPAGYKKTVGLTYVIQSSINFLTGLRISVVLNALSTKTL